MDFTIEEYNEVINLTIIEETDTLEFSIEETVEELNLTVEEYHGADGAKGEKPNHQWDGTSLRFENPDDTWGNYIDLKGDKGEDGGGLMSVVAGDNITIDNTDPLNPIINAEDGGTNVTKTSDLVNDGADGLNPYISLNDIPAVDISTKLDKPLAPYNVPTRVILADGTTKPLSEIGSGKASEVENDSTVTGASVKDALESLKAADKIETVVISLSPFNEDLLDNTSRLGMGVLTFPIKVLSFQTSAYPAPTGSGITTDLRKNGTSVATSVISAGATNSTGNPPSTFSADTFAIGDRLNFFTPTGGVGSTVKGQNLVATLIIERL